MQVLLVMRTDEIEDKTRILYCLENIEEEFSFLLTELI